MWLTVSGYIKQKINELITANTYHDVVNSYLLLMSDLNIHSIESARAYRQLLLKHAKQLSILRETEEQLEKALSHRKIIQISGLSWPTQSTSEFTLDYLYTNQGKPNYRERLICTKTGFNNRIRGAIHVFEQFCKPHKNDGVYLTEQLSPLYQWLVNKYPNTVGSEYITDSLWRNKIRFKLKLFPRKLNHQDLTALSYPDDQFEHVLSFDCLEHIPHYRQALREIFRVLRPQGKLLFSVPFDVNSNQTLVRASIDAQGEITHHVAPEYHGNPMSKDGSLSYYTFGWDLLNTLKTIGFNQSYALVYWSRKYAYLGGPQLLLFAQK